MRQYVLVCLVLLPTTAVVQAEYPFDLHALTFVDEEAWAVGDGGTIWHSGDRGVTWQRQQGPATANLRAVSFLDSQHGRAAGYEVVSGGERIRGRFLVTDDGGKHWTERVSPLLPGILGLAFVNPDHGWAWGLASPLIPSGVLRTVDGGRTWQAIPGLIDTAWTAGEARVTSGSVKLWLAGPGGLCGQVDGNRLLLLPQGPWEQEEPRVLRGSGDHLVLAGRQGLLVSRSVHGWQRHHVPAELPSIAGASAWGEKLWLVGENGGTIFQWNQTNQNWHRYSAGDGTVPLHAIAFADATHGCAVGRLGHILHTTDGGASWHRVVGDHDRIGLLVISLLPHDTPWDLLAEQASSDYLTRSVALISASAGVDPSLRFHAATLCAGSSGGDVNDQWELGPQTDPTIPDDVTDLRPQPSEPLPESLVGKAEEAIRRWRPTAILLGNRDERGPLDRLLQPVVQEAMRRAALPATDPTRSGWRVSELWAAVPEGTTYSIVASPQQISPRHESTVDAMTYEAAGICSDRTDLPYVAGNRHFARITPPADASSRSLFSHRDIPRGRPGRLAGTPFRIDESGWRERLAAQRNAHALLRYAEDDPSSPTVQLASRERLIQATHGMDDDDASQFLFRLTASLRLAGNQGEAIASLRQLVETPSRSKYQEASLARLWRWETSAELQHAARHVSTQLDDTESEPGARASELFDLAKNRFPGWYAGPRCQLSLAAWHRSNGSDEELPLIALPRNSGWLACFGMERWLQSGRGQPPLPRVAVTNTHDPPYLDGRLDEPCWADAARLQLGAPDANKVPTTVLVRCDDEYFYWAVECGKHPAIPYSPARSPRPRDADLTREDRVELSIDTDRDYTTAWQLSVDHRGWAADKLDDLTWDPTWHVAARSDATSWTVECAVPWEELVDQPPHGTDWLIQLRRVIPGQTVQHLHPMIDCDGQRVGLMYVALP